MFCEDPAFMMHWKMMMILYDAGVKLEFNIYIHFASPLKVQIGQFWDPSDTILEVFSVQNRPGRHVLG